MSILVLYYYYLGNSCFYFVSLALVNFPLKMLVCLFFAEVEEEKRCFFSNFYSITGRSECSVTSIAVPQLSHHYFEAHYCSDLVGLVLLKIPFIILGHVAKMVPVS